MSGLLVGHLEFLPCSQTNLDGRIDPYQFQDHDEIRRDKAEIQWGRMRLRKHLQKRQGKRAYNEKKTTMRREEGLSVYVLIQGGMRIQLLLTFPTTWGSCFAVSSPLPLLDP